MTDKKGQQFTITSGMTQFELPIRRTTSSKSSFPKQGGTTTFTLTYQNHLLAFNDIFCKICASVCEGKVCSHCEAFFMQMVVRKRQGLGLLSCSRRTVKNCRGEPLCLLTPGNTRSDTFCQFCRFSACIKAGLKPEMVSSKGNKAPSNPVAVRNLLPDFPKEVTLKRRPDKFPPTWTQAYQFPMGMRPLCYPLMSCPPWMTSETYSAAKQNERKRDNVCDAVSILKRQKKAIASEIFNPNKVAENKPKRRGRRPRKDATKYYSDVVSELIDKNYEGTSRKTPKVIKSNVCVNNNNIDDLDIVSLDDDDIVLSDTSIRCEEVADTKMAVATELSTPPQFTCTPEWESYFDVDQYPLFEDVVL